jgi:hypothetical protein
MKKNELSFLLQPDTIRFFTEDTGREPWVLVYESIKGKPESGAIFAAIIPNRKCREVLSNPLWDIQIGDGLPGCSVRSAVKREVVQYHRYGGLSGIEPLVYVRDFHDVKPSYIEIAEEFRLFHNLHHDAQSNVFVRISDSGTEEDVIRMAENSVQVNLKALRQFLAVKGACLAIYFDIVRYSPITIAEVDPASMTIKHRDADVCYDLYVRESDFKEEFQTLSRLLGKRLLRGMPKKKSGIWPYDKDKQEYVKFIVKMSPDSEPIEFTSDHEVLSNYSGANPGTPHYLTPVFFRREVLAKYYANPQKYQVVDGYLRCGALWGVQIDNNLDKYVVVFLGDLGRDLPHEEQLYWRSFNVPPEGGISKVHYRRSILAEETDPSRIDLRFKFKFQAFQEQWQQKHGWYLFSPLTEEDVHMFSTLRLPLTNDQAEFDAQVLALTKTLIDSINGKELEKRLSALEPDVRGITKLQRYLEAQGIQRVDAEIAFLRNLWELRSSGIGHRKGSKYSKVAKTFGIGQKPLMSVFEDILTEATGLIEKLESQL